MFLVLYCKQKTIILSMCEICFIHGSSKASLFSLLLVLVTLYFIYWLQRHTQYIYFFYSVMLFVQQTFMIYCVSFYCQQLHHYIFFKVFIDSKTLLSAPALFYCVLFFFLLYFLFSH